MSDEKIEAGGGEPAKKNDKPVDADRDTDNNPPEVQGGQPPVGDDLPRNTEF